MTRSIQRSKCRRARCLLCKPWRLMGERPVNDQRATLDDVPALTDEALEPPEHCYGEDDDFCPGCGCLVMDGVWPCECCGWSVGASFDGFPCRPDPAVVAFLLKMRGVA